MSKYNCAICRDTGSYYESTMYSCRDDGDGERYCDCIAAARQVFKSGGTCFVTAWAGKKLIEQGEHLSNENYKKYKESAEFMRYEVLPNA